MASTRLVWQMAAVLVATLLCSCAPKGNDGIAAYESGDYNKARAIFEKGSSDPVALFYMYRMSLAGNGAPPDYKAAIDYLERAAAKSHPPAMAALGGWLLKGDVLRLGLPVAKDKERGIGLLTAAAMAGHVEASAVLGRHYVDSGLVDSGVAMMLLAESTVGGKRELAHLYTHGAKGVAPKPELALRYLEELIALDPPPRLNNWIDRFDVAEFYYYGYGTPRDPRKAVAVLEPVIETAREARDLYAWLVYHGEGVPADPARAVDLWRRNEQASPLAGYGTLGLGLALATGNGIKKDALEAKAHFERAALSLDVMQLWELYLTGKGLTGLTCDSRIYSVSNPGEITPKAKGTRYESLARKALLSYGECKLAKAVSEKDATSRRFRVDEADMLFYAAGALGAVEAAALREKAMMARANGGVLIGMTAEQVLASKWGKPREVNRTQTSSGTREQWVYGQRNYLYFTNGLLDAIQN